MTVKLVRSESADGSGRVLSLSLNREYEVLGIEANWYRIVPEIYDERELGPYLYDRDCFEITDTSRPTFWVTSIDDSDEYSYPESWAHPGFFEDYHDGIRAVVVKFWNDLKTLYPKTWLALINSGQLKYLRII
jgi:hypothetical protein